MFDLSAAQGVGMYAFHDVWNMPGSDLGDASSAAPTNLGSAPPIFVADKIFTND
jgi:hypothetical protein